MRDSLTTGRMFMTKLHPIWMHLEIVTLEQGRLRLRSYGLLYRRRARKEGGGHHSEASASPFAIATPRACPSVLASCPLRAS